MTSKDSKTPKSRITQALRQLWMRSRERASALKRDKYTCQGCNRKQSMAKGKEFKVQVHHKCEGGIDWDIIEKVVREHLLCSPDDLITLCKECHKKEHDNE